MATKNETSTHEQHIRRHVQMVIRPGKDALVNSLKYPESSISLTILLTGLKDVVVTPGATLETWAAEIVEQYKVATSNDLDINKDYLVDMLNDELIVVDFRVLEA